MLSSELEKMYLKTDKGVVTPKYTFEKVIDILDEQGICIDKEYVGLVIIKTAQEAYDDWINREQIDNCSNPIKTNEQLTEENQFIKQQLKADKDFLTACIMEMAQIIYS